MDWQPTRRTDAYDVAVVMGLGVLAWLSLALGGDPEIAGPEVANYARPIGVALTVGTILPLAVRRRYPTTSMVVTTASFVVLRVIDIPEYAASALALFMALYTGGAYGARRWSAWRVGSAVAIVGLVIYTVAKSAEQAPEGKYLVLSLFTVVQNAFYLAAAWVLGDVVRARREREARLDTQAAELRASRDSAARQAVLEERVRMARELHDVLAHHVSVMGVEAAAARRVLASRPEEVPQLLTSIEASSRQAVAELQGLLGLLRQDDDETGTAPQPTLDDLSALAQQMREAGLGVEVDAPVPPLGPNAMLPPGVELSAYRIVQEALTNALKHAGPGTTASVQLRRQRASLELVVTDDGRGQPVDPPPRRDPAEPSTASREGPGHGLLGMRERATLHGGELRTGRRSGGGFEVRAWFPIPEGPAEPAGGAA